jgi:hypothetical protein
METDSKGQVIKPAKKHYIAPRLAVYGSFQSITATKGTAKTDGGIAITKNPG